MSGYTDSVMTRHGLSEGDYDFLEKPFSAEGLAAKVRGALASSAAGTEPGPWARPQERLNPEE